MSISKTLGKFDVPTLPRATWKKNEEKFMTHLKFKH